MREKGCLHLTELVQVVSNKDDSKDRNKQEL